MVANELKSRGVAGGTLYDIGCGSGQLAQFVKPMVREYVGVDLIAYDAFPRDEQFIKADFDQLPWPLPECVADIVTSVETIEHIENPREHVRQLTRLARPGGLVIVTTPNNLSWLSIFTLIRKGVFNAFQDGSYPAHITALVATDLLRISRECGLIDSRIAYSDHGRVPFTARSWYAPLRGKRFSDNLLISSRKSKSEAVAIS